MLDRWKMDPLSVQHKKAARTQGKHTWMSMLVPEVWSKQITTFPKQMSVEVPWQPQHKRGAPPHVVHRPALQDGLLQEGIHRKHLHGQSTAAWCMHLLAGINRSGVIHGKAPESRKHDMGNESARIDADTNEQLLVGT